MMLGMLVALRCSNAQVEVSKSMLRGCFCEVEFVVNFSKRIDTRSSSSSLRIREAERLPPWKSTRMFAFTIHTLQSLTGNVVQRPAVMRSTQQKSRGQREKYTCGGDDCSLTSA